MLKKISDLKILKGKTSQDILSALLVLLIISLAGYFLFRQTFDFALFGDDWNHFLRLRTCGGGEYKVSCWTRIINPYGGETAFMNLVYRLYGFRSRYYYLGSFLFRTIAAISAYFLAYALSRKQLAGLVASLLFMVSFGGLQTTEWVHYANVYLALAMLNFGFVALLKYYRTSINRLGSKLLPLYFLLFSVAIMISPIRSHGLFFLYPLMEMVLMFGGVAKKSKAITRMVIFIILVFVLKEVGFFGTGGPRYRVSQAKESLLYLSESTENLFKGLVFPLTTFTNMLFPPGFFDNIIFRNHLFTFSFSLKQFLYLFAPLLELVLLR